MCMCMHVNNELTRTSAFVHNNYTVATIIQDSPISNNYSEGVECNTLVAIC